MLTVTRELLERIDVKSLDELPPLRDFMPDAEAVEDMEARLSDLDRFHIDCQIVFPAQFSALSSPTFRP